jgi:Flp pilus assembly protein TadG
MADIVKVMDDRTIINAAPIRSVKLKALTARGDQGRARPLLVDERGVAGIEFALVAGLLCFLLLNGIDVARYAWIRMQVDNAAQIGVQAVWKACGPDKVPITPKCLNNTGNAGKAAVAAIDAAVASTSLKEAVTRVGAPSEGLYCADAAKGLVAVVDTDATCLKETGASTVAPGYYVRIDVTYTYAPLFADLTIASIFDVAISNFAYVRLQ